jgi:DNA (cytosine-5)-methyltransferase 1
MAAEALGLGPVAWYCENDPNASRLLSLRLPGVPNHGDLKEVKWAKVAPVDVIVAGYPCQGESLAGKRKGTEDERWIWPWIADAIRFLRPRLVLLENVAAHLGLGFPIVLGDLAEAGFDARWTTLRASDVGACHRRDRLFVVAHPVGDQPERLRGSGQLAGQERERERERDPDSGTATGSGCLSGWL